jgi:uncharacterized membrane protein YphA (DoxX/SURF4 family)
MPHDATTSPNPPGRAALWTGRLLSGIICAMLIISATMKFMAPPEMVENLGKIGIPMALLGVLGALELGCTLLYALPATATLGAVLLTGYLGGAVLTHLRIGESVILPVALGVVVWLGLYLRDPRLRQLLPLRSM